MPHCFDVLLMLCYKTYAFGDLTYVFWKLWDYVMGGCPKPYTVMLDALRECMTRVCLLIILLLLSSCGELTLGQWLTIFCRV